MKAIHSAPERKWTVADVAVEAAVSRSLLDQRFRQVLGLSPIRYVNEWRMRVAQDLLIATEVTIRRDRETRGVRLRRGVQPSLQTNTRAIAKPVARGPLGHLGVGR